MKRITIRRSPWASYALVAVLLELQFALSYRSATCRGYPPIDPIVEFVLPFVSYVGAMLFPFFDNNRSTRWRVRLSFSVGSAWILGAVLANQASSVPHVGHLLRPLGIFTTPGTLIFGLVALGITLLWVYYLDRVFTKVWARLRAFGS